MPSDLQESRLKLENKNQNLRPVRKLMWEKNGKTFLLEEEKWGIDYTFDCTGNTAIMREALEASHRGFG